MSVLAPASEPAPVLQPERKAGTRKRGALVLLLVALCAVSLWFGLARWNTSGRTEGKDIPTVKVARGDVSLSIFSRGEIRGGNSEVLSAPLMGGTELHVTSMRKPGEFVQPNEAVVQFDTTDQEFALREAESDMAEAAAHVEQAKAQLLADGEEDRYALAKGEADIRTAELDAKKNPLLATIVAKQNDLAVAVAKQKLAQLQQNLADRKATDEAGVAMQEAGRGKAESKSRTARENIAAMTLRAKRGGYVAIRQNTNLNMAYTGMALPMFQVGDTVRPGMIVAEIPDTKSWELAAKIGELDRGHLAVGDRVRITAIAIPHRTFRGHIKDIGGTSGMPWDRRFECTIAFDDTSDLLRAGMTTRIEVETESLRNALWVPAQALFESDGKMYVYLRQKGGGFARKDVTLIRRNETRVVLSGVSEGQEVALVNPAEVAAKKTASKTNPLEALPK